ncbi:MAG: hypothetical protein ABSG51_04125 [Terracidiphilus sp.]
MKKFLGLAFVLVLASAPAFAGKKNPTVTIPQTVQVGSTKLPAGDYKLVITGSEPNVQVTLTQNQKPVVTFSAKAVEGKSNPGIATDSASGSVILQSILLDHLTLVLDSAPRSGQ